MTDIEAKALALLNEVADERGNLAYFELYRSEPEIEALCRAIEQHEAFKQKVSDAIVSEYHYAEYAPEHMQCFIIPKPKPDPLVDAIESVLSGFESRKHAESYAHHIRAKLENSGFEIEIREKGQ